MQHPHLNFSFSAGVLQSFFVFCYSELLPSNLTSKNKATEQTHSLSYTCTAFPQEITLDQMGIINCSVHLVMYRSQTVWVSRGIISAASGMF